MVTRAFGKLSVEASRKEAARLQALEELDLLDSPRDPGFDRFVRLIREIFSVEIGIVSFIDGHRQWYKASAGMSVDELPRQDTFCRYVLASENPLVVPDALLDGRFSQHPVVTNPPHVRFYAGFPLKTEDGLVVGTICAIDSKPGSFGKRDMRVFEELAGAVMDRVALAKLAATDGLTGLLTRRSFKEEADRLISQALRHRHDVSCIMLDIDHFKSVNDRYGHQTGDDVIKAVASTCKKQLRAGDLFGRLGGEEFAIILPHVGREGARDRRKTPPGRSFCCNRWAERPTKRHGKLWDYRDLHYCQGRRYAPVSSRCCSVSSERSRPQSMRRLGRSSRNTRGRLTPTCAQIGPHHYQ